jgi:hypothetical protein
MEDFAIDSNFSSIIILTVQLKQNNNTQNELWLILKNYPNFSFLGEVLSGYVDTSHEIPNSK